MLIDALVRVFLQERRLLGRAAKACRTRSEGRLVLRETNRAEESGMIAVECSRMNPRAQIEARRDDWLRGCKALEFSLVLWPCWTCAAYAGVPTGAEDSAWSVRVQQETRG